VHWKVVQMERVEIPGSYRSEPEGAELLGEVDGTSAVDVTVFLKSPKASDSHSSHRELTRKELHTNRVAELMAAQKPFEDFAAQANLHLRWELSRRCVRVFGNAHSMQLAFATCVRRYKVGGRYRFRARSGSLWVSAEVAPWIQAVLGFDHRAVVGRASPQTGETTSLGLWPSEIARLYNLPSDQDGAGQCIGLIALGGGYWPGDLAKAAQQMNLPVPVVVDSGVGDAKNQFTGGDASDQEVALDIQVLAGIVPGARIVVYFAGNTTKSLATAIEQAVSDSVNRPQVLSISWGSAEKFWTDSARAAVETSLADAVKVKMTVLAAAGDSLATAGLSDGTAHVLYPASSPSVLACGGTRMVFSDGGKSVTNELVWNDEFSGTGGGISDVFDPPDYQQNASLPNSVNAGRSGRGVPDIAALASQDPGYKVVVGGETIIKDGTSAATPLWAAVIALANSKRGRPLGSVHDFLYRNPLTCRQVLEGNNWSGGIGYEARPGWNACTGWGVPKGLDTIESLASMP
jgi:kumamolisin